MQQQQRKGAPRLGPITGLTLFVFVLVVVVGPAESAPSLSAEQPNPQHATLNRINKRASEAANSSLLAEMLQTRQKLPAHWSHNYIGQRFSADIKDETVDQRLANILRTANLARPFYYFAYKFDSPIRGLDNGRLEQLAAGPRVDDELCGRHLASMGAQMRELSDIKEQGQRSRGAHRDADDGLAERHLRLADLLDSFGHYDAGALMGRNYFIGSYSQCKSSQLLLPAAAAPTSANERQALVSSRYCVASLDATKWQDADIRLAKQRLSKLEPAEDVLAVGICLPDSCHTKSFARNRGALQALVDSQFELPAGLYQDQHLELAGLFCEIDPESPLLAVPLSGKLLLAFLALWLAAVLYSTYRQEFSNTKWTETASEPQQQQADASRSIGHRLAGCLSLRAAWDEFIGAEERNFEGPQHRVSLGTLNPIKVGGCLLVVFGHSIIVSFGASMDTLQMFKDVQTDEFAFFMFGTTVIVDSYYVITGIIFTFMVMKRFKANKNTVAEQEAAVAALNEGATMKTMSIYDMNDAAKTRPTSPALESGLKFVQQSLMLILVRFLRLVPLYFLVFWFKKSLMTILSSGPLWDHGYNRETEAGACREESWLTPFTFQAAYLPISRQCMPQAWSVAGDLFFSCLVAPIIVLMASRPMVAALISVLLSVASNISMLKALLAVDVNLLQDMLNADLVAISKAFRTLSFLYTAPHLRVFSVLVGALAGYALYHYSKATSEGARSGLRHWPHWMRGPATKAALLYTLCSLAFAPLVPTLKETLFKEMPLHKLMAVHLFSTHRLLWSFSSALIYLRMVTDWKDNFWMRNGAGKFMSSMSRLNLAILMVHLDLLKFDLYKQLSPPFYSYTGALRQFAFAYLFSLPLALLLYVTFESPMDKLVKLALTLVSK